MVTLFNGKIRLNHQRVIIEKTKTQRAGLMEDSIAPGGEIS
jgi:hypothetical protein